MYTIWHTTMDAYIQDSTHTTVCNKSYYGQCNINAIHKGDQCKCNIVYSTGA